MTFSLLFTNCGAPTPINSESGASLQQIIGSDNRTRIDNIEQNTHMALAISFKDNFICNGFFVAPHVIATASHCLMQYTFGLSPLSDFQAFFFKSSQEGQIVEGDKNSFLRVVRHIPQADYIELEVESLTSKVFEIGKLVETTKSEIRAYDDGSSSLTSTGFIKTDNVGQYKYISYAMSTEPGTSGAPIFQSNKIVGMHLGFTNGINYGISIFDIDEMNVPNSSKEAYIDLTYFTGREENARNLLDIAERDAEKNAKIIPLLKERIQEIETQKAEAKKDAAWETTITVIGGTIGASLDKKIALGAVAGAIFYELKGLFNIVYDIATGKPTPVPPHNPKDDNSTIGPSKGSNSPPPSKDPHSLPGPVREPPSKPSLPGPYKPPPNWHYDPGKGGVVFESKKKAIDKFYFDVLWPILHGNKEIMPRPFGEAGPEHNNEPSSTPSSDTSSGTPSNSSTAAIYNFLRGKYPGYSNISYLSVAHAMSLELNLAQNESDILTDDEFKEVVLSIFKTGNPMAELVKYAEIRNNKLAAQVSAVINELLLDDEEE